MKRASAIILPILICTAEFAFGLASTSAYARQSTAQAIRDQRQLLLQQQRELKQNQRRIAAQRQQLAQQGTAGAPKINHGLWGDCPLGYTYYLLEGCGLSHNTVVILNGN